MQAFEVNDLIHQASEQNKRSLEFLRVPPMSLGIYRLAAGEPDPLSPHKQDEVYYVLSGKAKLQEESRLQPVQTVPSYLWRPARCTSSLILKQI